MGTQGHQLQGQCSSLFVILPQVFLERVVVGFLPLNSLKKLCVQWAPGSRPVGTNLRGTRHTLLGLLQTIVFHRGQEMGLGNLGWAPDLRQRTLMLIFGVIQQHSPFQSSRSGNVSSLFMEGKLGPSVFLWENWHSESSSHLPKIRRQVTGGARVWAQVSQWLCWTSSLTRLFLGGSGATPTALTPGQCYCPPGWTRLTTWISFCS